MKKTPKSYYAVLGLKVAKPAADGGEWDYPASDKVLERWREKVALAHPARHPEGEHDEWDKRFRELMEARAVLLDGGPSLARTYQEFLEGAQDGHTAFLASPHHQPFGVELPDWVAMLVHDLIGDAVDQREASGDKVIEAARKLPMGGLPEVIPADRIQHIESLDVGEVLNELLDTFREDFQALRMFRTDYPSALSWYWVRKPFRDMGRKDQVARPLALNERARAHRPGADNAKPWAEVKISLAWWLVATDDERRRELHAALTRYFVENGELKVQVPAVTTSASRMRAWGVQDADEAELVAEALRHADTIERLEHYGVLPSGQGVLWRQAFVDAQALEPSAAAR